MRITKLPNEHLLVPRPAYGPDGITGDGVVEVGPEDPDYAEWLDEYRRDEAFYRAVRDGALGDLDGGHG